MQEERFCTKAVIEGRDCKRCMCFSFGLQQFGAAAFEPHEDKEEKQKFRRDLPG